MSTHDEAQAALGRAARVESAALRNSGWYTRYLWVFAAGQLALVPMSLLWQGITAALVFALSVFALVGGLSVYAARQRVVRRGFGALHGGVIGSWAALFAVSVGLGTSSFEDSVPFAVVAAVACALPPGLAAIAEGRRTA
ncbi:hypothetical protein [Streptomyces tsukubensis]|uniref:hypothetical protein n=1 Tax=Streptomyces tsukubensis TaxID=83656 RepID=UPI00344B797A